jgi:TatD DNase family protein
MHLADSHAHLDLEDHFPDQVAVLKRARQAQVDLVINVATGLADAPQVIATARQTPGMVAIIGVHPHGAATMTDADLVALDSLAADPHVVAIGEIGLDFYRRRAPAEVQQHWFRRQLEFAIDHQKVVVIHTREATPVTLAILQEYQSRLLGGVMHCFGGSLTEAHAFLDLGFYLSFSGTLTYPKAGPLRDVAQKVPIDRILVETDCPYLPPQPWRGKRNEPAYIVTTAQQLADTRGLTLEEVAAHTWANTLTVFGLTEAAIIGQQPNPAQP